MTNDKRVWLLESSGKFTSKSFFKALSNPSPSDLSFSHRMIWKPTVPPRVKAFSWIVVLGRINMMDLLQRRRSYMLLSPHWCSLCHKDAESVHYIFLHCSFTSKVWNHFISHMCCYWVMPKNLNQMFSSWRSFGANIKSTHFGECLLHAILWNLW